MGKNRQQEPEIFESTTEACSTCWYGEANEHGSIKCPLEIEPMGRADRCGEWTATDPGKTTPANSGVETSLAGRDVAEEAPTVESTTDFNLYGLHGYRDCENDAVKRIYEYLQDGGEGEPGFVVSVKFVEGIAKAKIRISLPNDIKFDLPETGYVRENGTIRLERGQQDSLFTE